MSWRNRYGDDKGAAVKQHIVPEALEPSSFRQAVVASCKENEQKVSGPPEPSHPNRPQPILFGQNSQTYPDYTQM